MDLCIPRRPLFLAVRPSSKQTNQLAWPRISLTGSLGMWRLHTYICKERKVDGEKPYTHAHSGPHSKCITACVL